MAKAEDPEAYFQCALPILRLLIDSLGFAVEDKPDVKIDIGDEYEDKASIKITWVLKEPDDTEEN